MKVVSVLLAALSLSAATAATASNIRGSSVMDDDGEQLSISKSRQLQQQYDATSTNDAPLSGGTWLFYLMLNAFMFPFDAAGYGCNSCDDDATTTTYNNNNNYYEDNKWGGRSLWGSDSWGDDGFDHQSSSSSFSSSSHHSSSSRCKVPHAPKLKSHPPPKPPSSPQKHHSASASASASSGGGSSHSYSTWTHDGYDYDAPAWATDGYDESSIQVSHLTDGNGSNIENAANMAMIVGAAVAALAAIAAAAAFMMKKGCFKNGILPSRWNHNKPDVEANTLPDTDDSSSSDDDDDINRDNYIEMTDLQYEELARADTNSHGAGYTGKLMEKLGALRSSANMLVCPAKMLCPSKNTVTV